MVDSLFHAEQQRRCFLHWYVFLAQLHGSLLRIKQTKPLGVLNAPLLILQDFNQQPPAQELIATDLHGNEWKFRHIFRGRYFQLLLLVHNVVIFCSCIQPCIIQFMKESLTCFNVILHSSVRLNQNKIIGVGQPKRHLLTTGWSVFVSAKRLVAGDSVLFIWYGIISFSEEEKAHTLLSLP